MSNHSHVILNLAYFENYAREDYFVHLWGGRLGKHLWEKFVGCEFRALSFFKQLDLENRQILVSALAENPTDSAWLEKSHERIR